MTKLDDVGEYIPYAAKHLRGQESSEDGGDADGAYDGRQLADGRAKQIRREYALAKLWPEPDWVGMVRDGKQEKTVAYMAMFYHSLNKCPRTEKCRSDIDAEDWPAAYAEALIHLRQLFIETHTLEDARNITSRLAKRLGKSLSQIGNERASRNLVFWAAGKGTSRLQSPGYLSLHQTLIAKHLFALGWPHHGKALLASKLTPFPDNNAGKTEWRVGKARGRSVYFEDGIYQSAEEACAKIVSILEAEAASKSANQKPDAEVIDKKPEISLSEAMAARDGQDWRKGRNVTAEELMETFALRGVQFGASIPKSERQQWVNAAFDALADLADIIGWPRSWLGFKGELALAIGARGRKGNAAHYEPSLKVINLTRRAGAGTLAHEWAHGFDFRVGRTLYQSAKHSASEVLVSHLDTPGRSALTPISLAIKATLDAIYHKPGSSHHYSKFYLAARALDSKRPYWSTAAEMFARAIEAFVDDELLANGQASPLLVHGTMLEKLTKQYPCDEERIMANMAIRQMFKAIAQTARSQ